MPDDARSAQRLRVGGGHAQLGQHGGGVATQVRRAGPLPGRVVTQRKTKAGRRHGAAVLLVGPRATHVGHQVAVAATALGLPLDR